MFSLYFSQFLDSIYNFFLKFTLLWLICIADNQTVDNWESTEFVNLTTQRIHPLLQGK